jgi:hypothetical protein
MQRLSVPSLPTFTVEYSIEPVYRVSCLRHATFHSARVDIRRVAKALRPKGNVLAAATSYTVFAVGIELGIRMPGNFE